MTQMTLLDAILEMNDSIVWTFLRDRPKSFGIPYRDKMPCLSDHLWLKCQRCLLKERLDIPRDKTK
jgi:hypothetical protein